VGGWREEAIPEGDITKHYHATAMHYLAIEFYLRGGVGEGGRDKLYGVTSN